MKHFYTEDSDGIVVTFNDIREDNGIDTIPFYIEQLREVGDEPFNYAEGKLPFYRFENTYGFTDEQLASLMDYMKRNSVLIYEIARKEAAKP
jgi:hypothetical protein